jgi:endonuclease-3
MARETKAGKQARALEVLRRLEGAYPGADCALHWENPFELLVATILSAQTSDEQVNRITPDLFRRYPNAAAFAAARQEDVEAAIKSIGLFRNKAKNLRLMSQQLCEEFDGDVPQSMDELITLPGVARKTANVLLGTAFHIPSGIVVDTHVHRLAIRIGLCKRTERYPEKVEKELMPLFPQDKWVFLGHALILHGRQVCTARAPQCEACPVEDVCPKRL